MTEHGSSPGRPRGRRARHDGGEPGQQGYDGTPQDEREFPDLTPIRPREAGPRDARGQGDWGQGDRGQQAQPDAGYGQYGTAQYGTAQYGTAQYGSTAPYDNGQYDNGQYDNGQYGNGQYRGGRQSGGQQGAGQPSAGQYGTGQPSGGQPSSGQYGTGQHGGGQRGAGQYGTGQYGGGYPDGAYPAPGPGTAGQQRQAPWGDQAWPGQQAPVGPDDQTWAGQPGYPPAAQHSPSGQYQAQGTPVAPAQQVAPAVTTASPRKSQREDDVPSWAEPDSVEAFSARWHRRGLDSRGDRRGSRRNRRRLLVAGGVTVALVIGAVAYLLSGGPGAANLGFGNFVTQFLPGELQQVPDACAAVPQATLSVNLPGKLKLAAPPLNSGPNSQCTWTLDSPPTYKVLEVSLMAYSPSGLASGTGSATFAAEDAYQTAEAGFQKPGPESGQPVATVTDLSGMPGGTETSSFATTQVYNRGGEVEDVVNVVVRYRNVIITVTVNGLDKSGPASTKKYGPVQMGDLTATGKSVAQQVASQIVK